MLYIIFQDGIIQHYKLSILSKLTSQFNIISIKMPRGILRELASWSLIHRKEFQMDSWFTCESNGQIIAKAVSEKKNLKKELATPGTKIDHKAMVCEKVGTV